MSKKFRTLLLFTALLLHGPIDAYACIVRYRPAEDLKREAGLVVQAIVSSKTVSGRALIGELYTYTIEIRIAERGEFSRKVTSVTYYNVRAHERDGLMECPMKDGAGIETDLQLEQNYRLYLKTPENREILFAEKIGEYK